MRTARSVLANGNQSLESNKRDDDMNQHLHLITLGVKDFERSFRFYAEILGWRASSASQDDVAFFRGGRRGVWDLSTRKTG